jgi:UDPglucose 6-dehydrogenase
VRAYDPQAMENAKSFFTDVTYVDDAYSTADGADALVLATEWNEFRALNFERIKKALRSPVVIDLRNVYDPHRMASLGFSYTSVGRIDDRRKRPR